ncbi:cell division protein ZapA [Candidatus Dependentiae bacterium]|nr:cell division protein ZapA [Candidatus Dependentiae bacterium]
MKESTDTQPPLTLSSATEKGPNDGSPTVLLKRYKVTIAGESYFLVSDEPEERLKAVAQLIDTKIQTLTRVSHNDDSKRIATLVALQYASTTIACEERAEKLIAHITEALSLFSL